MHHDELLSIPMFASLSGLERAAIAGFIVQRELDAGEVLWTEGDTGHSIIFIRSGRILCIRRNIHPGPKIRYTVGEGRYLGEPVLRQEFSRTTTCRAEVPTVIFEMEAIDFYRVVYEYPMIGIKVLKPMIRELIGLFRGSDRYLNDMAIWGEITRRRSIMDDMTDLYNRRFVVELLPQHVRAAGKTADGSCSLVLIDIDRFRDLNLKWGAAAGDSLIANLAPVFRRTFRSSDICARLSGDEFAVILPATPMDDAFVLAENLKNEVASLPFVFGPPDKAAEFRITLSLGVASFPETARTETDLWKQADTALFSAKTNGRNRVERAPGSRPKTA